MFLFSSCVSKQTANYDNRTKHILGLDCERNPRKCTDIGLSYERGVGVPSNIYIAIDLYTRSCEAGYARACSYLSDKYVSDELRLKYNCIIKNHHKDIEKAKIDEESKDKLKQLFADPKKGVMTKNEQIKKGIEVLYKTATQGTPINPVDIAETVTNKCEYDNYSKQTQKIIFELYTKACAQNFLEACHSLAMLYYKGYGTKKSIKKSKYYLKKSITRIDRRGLTFVSFINLSHIDKQRYKYQYKKRYRDNCFTIKNPKSCIYLIRYTDMFGVEDSL